MSDLGSYWTLQQRRRLQRRTFLGVTATGAVGAGALLAGCSSSKSSSAGNSGGKTTGGNAPVAVGPGGATPASAGTAAAIAPTNATVRVGIGSDAGSMDPMSLAGTGGGNWVNTVVHFDTPMKSDPATGKPYGNLFESFTPSDDGLSWTAKIRAGITFHNGEPYDATALQFSAQRALGTPTWDPSFQSGLAPQFSATLQGVEVVDPLTATFHMKAVDVSLPAKLAGLYAMPPKYTQATDDNTLAQKPVGSGVFQFVSRTPDQEIRSTRFDKYFRKPGGMGPWLPYVKDLVQTVYPDDQARIDALKAGNVDMVFNVPSAQAKALQGDTSTRLVYLKGDQPMHIMINTTLDKDPDTGKPNPWKDMRVRQAANMAIDLPTIIKSLLTGQEQRSFGSSSFSLGFPKDLPQNAFKYDPTAAKQLLTQAGYADGFDAVMHYPVGRWPNTVEVCQALAGYLGKVGIKVTLDPLQYQVVTTKLKEKSLYPLTFWGMSGTSDPSQNFLIGYKDGGTYVESPSGPDVSAMIDQQAAELDVSKRGSLIGKIITQFYTDARWIFLYEPITVVATSNKWIYAPYFVGGSGIIDYFNIRPAS